MGKKKTRSSMTSKGDRRSVVAGVKEVRQSRDPCQIALNKLKAWRKGQNPWITVPGPSPNKSFVRVRANVLYGDPKKVRSGVSGGKDE
jgi:hypothetical protein